MKKNNCKSAEVKNDHYTIKDQNDAQSILSDYDRDINRLKELSLKCPDEKSREDIERWFEYLEREKGMVLKASRDIIKSALKGTEKWIQLCYPALLNWNEADRVYQLRTKRPFNIEMIEYLGKDIKSVKCTCRDGEVRVFEIRKIEAFYGIRKSRKGMVSQCVNVYF